jgi:hypothetical protein
LPWDALLGEAVGVPPPWLDSDLYRVLAGYRQIGHDANGSLLFVERSAWLDRHVDEPGEREAFDFLFDQVESENATIQLEEFEALRDAQR